MKDERTKPHAGTRVLIMDDDDTVRKVVLFMLTADGFDAEGARDGEEAIEKYEAARNAQRPFDVVVLDLTVPAGMNGKEAIRRLKTIDPDVLGIISSGRSADEAMEDHTSHGFVGAVTKPFEAGTLTAAITEALAQRPANRCSPDQ